MAKAETKTQDFAGMATTADPNRPLTEAEIMRQGRNQLRELKEQDRVRVVLPWTREDEQAHTAGKAVSYPKTECVQINDVRWFVKRGKAEDVPVSVAEVLVNAGKIPVGLLPDGNAYRAWQEEEDARQEAAAEEARRDKMRKAGLIPA